MPYDINAALERLEKNLQDLDSARNQVESAVKSSTDLQSVVSEYVSSVKTLCVGLQACKADLKAKGESLSYEYEEAISRANSTCTEIIKSFSTVVEQTSTDFKNNTGSIVEKFTEQNRILSEHVLDLNSLKENIKKATAEIQVVKESLSQISKDLAESQKEQDAVLNDIKLNTDALPTVISSTAENVNQKLNSLQAITDNTYTLLSQINTLDQEIRTVSQQIQLTLQASSESLSHISKDLKDSLESQDAVLNDINQKVEAFPTYISSTAESINEKLNSIQNKNDSIGSLLTQVNSLSIDIKSAIERNLSTVQSSTESLLNFIESSKKETAKSININRWITIAAFIIITIFIFVCQFFDFKL